MFGYSVVISISNKYLGLTKRISDLLSLFSWIPTNVVSIQNPKSRIFDFQYGGRPDWDHVLVGALLCETLHLNTRPFPPDSQLLFFLKARPQSIPNLNHGFIVVTTMTKLHSL